MPTTTRIRKSPRTSSSYKLKIMDESHSEEVFSMDLSRWRIYTFFSSLFVMMAVLTTLVIVFTPLKYYIPGYGSIRAQKEAVTLKARLDSLNTLVKEQQVYTANIKAVINGKFDGVKDTSMLDLKKVKTEDMNSILPDADDIMKDATATMKKQNTSKLKH